MELNRRFVLKTGGAVALASSVGPWPIARAADTLTVAAYGGEFEEIFRRTVTEPFEKKFWRGSKSGHTVKLGWCSQGG